MELQWPLILFTFFLCIAGGTLAMQGLLTALGKGKEMQLPSLIVALVALAVGGISVFLHLEHWERIFNGFGHITSGITLEFIGCIVFGIVLVVYFLLMHRSEDGMAPKWIGVVGIIVGLALCAVTGDSYLMPAIPVWNTPLLPLFYVVNACFFGGLIGLIIAGAKNATDSFDLCLKVSVIAGIAQLVVVLIYAIFFAGSNDIYTDLTYYFDPTLPDVGMVDTAAITGSILSGTNAVAYWIGVVVVGILAPVVLMVLALRKKIDDAKQLMTYAGVALVCAVIGAIIWRCILYVVAISVLPFY